MGEELHAQPRRKRVKPLPCFVCGGPATLLCDGLLAWRAEWDGERLLVATRREDVMVTCDRPMCEGCVASREVWFLDWSLPGGGRRGSTETSDRCADCEREREERRAKRGAPPENCTAGWVPLVDDEGAEALQRRQLLTPT